MVDPRLTTLARNLIHQSLKIKPGEKVLIESIGQMPAFVQQLVAETAKVGALPFVRYRDLSIVRALLQNATEEQLRLWADFDLYQMKQMDAYIGVRGVANDSELADVPEDKRTLYARLYTGPVHLGERLNNTKWVVLRYPTDAMAQSAAMSMEAFEDFYFDVCNLDYGRLSRAMDPLVEWMSRTDRVHIIGPGTDLTFSIKGIPVIKCDGACNIPDGEIYTAPVRDSVNGVLSYNTPSLEGGYCFENIRFVFKDGKIVEATANDTARINKVLDVDEGARFVGEFALGVNPYITKAMKDTLFDEKISGSFHFTPGNSYDDAPNGNKSANHWDLVCIQTPEYGGGEIWFDDVLIRKDGLFVPEALQGLNPDHLL